MDLVPTEDVEQAHLVAWLDLRGFSYFRVPNETFTRSWKQRAKNKRLGVKPGVPDLFVIAGRKLIAIEMKRRKGSTTSAAQQEWIERLNAAGVPSSVCRGFDEAREFVELHADRNDHWPERRAA